MKKLTGEKKGKKKKKEGKNGGRGGGGGGGGVKKEKRMDGRKELGAMAFLGFCCIENLNSLFPCKGDTFRLFSFCEKP